MISPELIPRIAEGLIWRYVDDDTVLVNPRTGAVRVLNDVGTLIWKMMEKQNSVGEIESFLASHYRISGDDVHNDLSQFLDELAARGLVCWQA